MKIEFDENDKSYIDKVNDNLSSGNFNDMALISYQKGNRIYI